MKMRRAILIFVALACVLPCTSVGEDKKSTPIIKAVIDVVPEKTYPSEGDIWISTWADDNSIYSVNGDGKGFDPNGRSSQVALTRLEGNDPTALKATPLPALSQYENKFGGSTKTMGITSIDGVLYVALNGMGKVGKKNQSIPVNSAYSLSMHNSTILKSLDHGATWVPAPGDIGGHYTFPGTMFPVPSFINYGKDGTGRPVEDKSGKYVYLTSNDVGWSNGDYYMLARVLKSKLPDLNGADYQFYVGGDGLRDENWTRDIARIGHIIDNPGKCGMSTVQYNPVLGRYIMVGWFFTELYPRDDSYSVLSVYESPTPWGKWTLVGLSDAYPYGWYDPGILGKFTSSDGKTMKLAAGSDAPQGDNFSSPRNYYHFNVLTMKLYTAGDTIPPSPKNSNLNLFKPVTASSVYNNSVAYAGERVNDGNRLTNTYYWQPQSGKDEWVCIDFGRMETVNRTEIFEFSSATVTPRVEDYKVQYWDRQSSSWRDAVSHGGAIGTHKTDRFPDITSNKIRLLIVSTKKDDRPRILEFQAFDMYK